MVQIRECTCHIDVRHHGATRALPLTRATTTSAKQCPTIVQVGQSRPQVSRWHAKLKVKRWHTRARHVRSSGQILRRHLPKLPNQTLSLALSKDSRHAEPYLQRGYVAVRSKPSRHGVYGIAPLRVHSALLENELRQVVWLQHTTPARKAAHLSIFLRALP